MDEFESLILTEYLWIDRQENVYVSDKEYYEMLEENEDDETSDG